MGGQFTQAQYGNDANGDPIAGEFEFYVGDNFNNDSHTETTMGSVAIVPGSGELIVSAFDPIKESQQGKVYSNGFILATRRVSTYGPFRCLMTFLRITATTTLVKRRAWVVSRCCVYPNLSKLATGFGSMPTKTVFRMLAKLPLPGFCLNW